MPTTVTTTDTGSDYGFLKNPYLIVKIIEATNLGTYSEASQGFNPYVKLKRNSFSSKTKPKKET